MTGNMHNVFVYGSLKQGFGNHNHFLGRSKYLGPGVTEKAEFEMRSLTGFPAVCRKGGSYSGNRKFAIMGELYSVNDLTLQMLDRLESNGKMYQREMVPIVDFNGKTVYAWMYLFLFSIGGYDSYRVFTINLNRDTKAQNWELEDNRKQNESENYYSYHDVEDDDDDQYTVLEDEKILYASGASVDDYYESDITTLAKREKRESTSKALTRSTNHQKTFVTTECEPLEVRIYKMKME